MFDLIIIGIVIYSIYKKYNKNSTIKITSILHKKGFHNIIPIEQTQDSFMLTADLNGDNYLFKIMKNNSSISNSYIHSLMESATKLHYHNVILIPGNAIISGSAKSLIDKYNIQVWNNAKLNEFSNSDEVNNVSTIIKTSPVYDTCKIDTPEDPIQDGTKANSIFGNLFGNKIERL